ncbi:MAG: mechanosensitive ion channel family protein [Longicatena sp.]
MQDFMTSINTIGKGSFFTYGLIGTFLIVLIYISVAYIMKHMIGRAVRKKHMTNEKFILRLVKIIIYSITIYSCLSLVEPFNEVLVKIWGSAGILAVAAGLAAQESLGNLVNGLLIATFKPFKIGDLVKVNNGEFEGYVVDVSLRDTLIRTYENTRIIIPNSIMNKAVLENVSLSGNSKGNFLTLEIDYDSDLDKAMQIIKEEVMHHDNFIDARSHEEIEKGIDPVITRVIGFNESGLSLRTTIYSKNNAEGFAMLSDLRISIKKAFDKNGIEFPYPHRTIVYKKETPNT